MAAVGSEGRGAQHELQAYVPDAFHLRDGILCLRAEKRSAVGGIVYLTIADLRQREGCWPAEAGLACSVRIGDSTLGRPELSPFANQ